MFVTLVFLSAVRQSQQPRPSAKDYFEIKVARIEWKPYTNNRSVIVKRVVLNITAVGGEATSIILQNNASPNQEEYVSAHPHLDKGESWCDEYSTLNFDNYIAQINGKGEIVLDDVITIGCKEAEGATITLYIPESIWRK